MIEEEPAEEEDYTTEELTDLVFGMFTLFMQHRFEKRGTHLFELVKKGEDMTAVCEECAAAFLEEYPVFREPFAACGGAKEIAVLFSLGEGTVPTKTFRSYWIWQEKPGCAPGAASAEAAGKWLMFVQPEEADSAWEKIRDATLAGKLGIGAKISTSKENEDSHDDRKVIYVFTENWENEEDVMRVRAELKTIGFTDRIGYKRNLDTYAGEYREKGKRVTYYSV
ncbi:MAG TPA: DUF1917 domain-containing protein [Methanocorpusculum sp.]|nr:DUF1917 domain-containing protein [Methanocorpusculum sp.]